MSTDTLDDPASPPLAQRGVGDTGVVVSPIGLDGSVFGWAVGDDESARILDAFVALGGNLVSTADHYAGGRSEIMIGSWLKTITDRSRLVIATEVGRHPDSPGRTQRRVVRAVESSLDRLGTDYIDFLAVDVDDHDEDAAIDEMLEAVDRLIRAGKVRFMSASGVTTERVDEVAKLADEARYLNFRALFVEYSLMDRAEYETRLQPVVARLGRGTLARLPLANGYLSGRFRTREAVPDSVMYADAHRYLGRRGTRVLEALDAVAGEIDSTPTRVALAWVLVKPGIAAAVVRAKDAERLEHALGAREVRLTRAQVAQLDRASE